MSKTFIRHSAELDTGFYGSGFIRGLRLSMHRRGRIDYGWSFGNMYSGLKPEEIDALLERIEKEHPRIDAKQSAKGLAWLLDVWKTPRGTVRKTSPFSYREVLILENFDHFELGGFWDTSAGYGTFFLPVYRVVAKNGDHFSYYAGSWQSGVPLTIL